MPGRPPRRWVNLLVVAVVLALAAGGVLVAIQKARLAAAFSTSHNNLKQIVLASQNFHDTYLRFPGNGSGVDQGLVSPTFATACPFFYQINPYIEADTLYRLPQQASPETPVVLRCYSEPARNRRGHVRGQPVTDYAVNLCALYGVGVTPSADNLTATLNLGAVKDGPEFTILIGGKAMHPADYDTADPAVEMSFLNTAAGGANRCAARYTIGATTALPALTEPPPAGYTHPPAVRDWDAPAEVPSDAFGGPYPGGTLFAFLDGSVRSLNAAWLDPGQEVATPPVAWGTPPAAGTFDRVSQFRAALTPSGGEQVVFE